MLVLSACTYPLMPDKVNKSALNYPSFSSPVAEFIGVQGESRMRNNMSEIVILNPIVQKGTEHTYSFNITEAIMSPMTEAIIENFVKSGAVIDNSYKFPGPYMLSELSFYKHKLRYLTWIEPVKKSVILRDNSGFRNEANFFLSTIILSPFALMSAFFPPSMSLQLDTQYNIYVYDTKLKEIIKKEEANIIRNSAEWKGYWEDSPEETYNVIGYDLGKIIAAGIVKKYKEIFKDLPQESVYVEFYKEKESLNYIQADN